MYIVFKDYYYFKEFKKRVEDVEKVVIIGGGFIVFEVGDEIRKFGKDVMIVVRSRLLRNFFDFEFSEMIENRFKEVGINVVYGYVERLVGRECVEGVKFVEGGEIFVDLVIFLMGYCLNVELVVKIGLKVIRYGIWIDEYMRIFCLDIFVVGDCVEYRDFFIGKFFFLMLVLMVIFEVRIVGVNFFKF